MSKKLTAEEKKVVDKIVPLVSDLRKPLSTRNGISRECVKVRQLMEEYAQFRLQAIAEEVEGEKEDIVLDLNNSSDKYERHHLDGMLHMAEKFLRMIDNEID